MKVQFALHRPSWNPTGYYSAETPEFCCEEMKAAWDEDAIGFGHPQENGKASVVCIRQWHCYPEGAACDIFEIHFCPFCAEVVTVHAASPACSA